MSDPWTVLAGLGAIALGFVLIPVVTDVYFRFRGARRRRCPEAGVDADVSVDARQAALTAAWGEPSLRVAACSLWPERHACAEACLAEPAREAAPAPGPAGR